MGSAAERSRENGMTVRHAVGPGEYAGMTTAELRGAFMIEDLFRPGEVRLCRWEYDRMVVGSAVPGKAPLPLQPDPAPAAGTFCARREIGILNIGGPGTVEAGGVPYDLDPLDALYVGRGGDPVLFRSLRPRTPAKFFLVSAPAHADYPTVPVRRAQARPVPLGSEDHASRRLLHPMIHAEGTAAAQLAMGFTQIETGSVWNTMPPHTHPRRSEVYLYFDLGPDDAVFHLMGRPGETRHLVAREGQAVLSPPWSIHAGCGTGPYRFAWAMAGENRTIEDTDGAAVRDLR